MKIADPLWLVLLPLAVASGAYLWLWRPAQKARPRVSFSLAHALKELPRGARPAFSRLPLFLRTLVIVCLIVALARPQGNFSRDTFQAEGIDIVLVVDTSGSMQFDDFQPNRLEAAKKVAVNFIMRRPQDRIGYVTFDVTAETRSPLTFDHAALATIIGNTELEGRQTAIGVGVATAVNRLRESDGASKVVILLTDGQNNAGEIDPATAAEAAKAMGVRLYTIGVGQRIEEMNMMKRFFGQVPQPVNDEELTKIAEITGGRYFRAENEEALQKIYDEIGKLETKPLEAGAIRQYKEYFPWWAAMALIALFAEFVLRRTALQELASEGV